MTLRLRTLRLHQICDGLTEALIYSMAIFSPWAFGTTQKWSIWTMTIAGYTLGALLLVKLYIRWFRGYRAPRWGDPPPGARSCDEGKTMHWAGILTAALVILTVAIVGYCLIAALNARSTYRAAQLSFEYHKYIAWLPHSYASEHSWFAFWKYLGLALTFWAVRDWLLGKTTPETRAARAKTTLPPANLSISAPQLSALPESPISNLPSSTSVEGSEVQRRFQLSTFPISAFGLPARLRRLLWLLTMNAALVSVVGMAQRASGTDKVLWLVKPRIPAGAYGPYNYQSNAAQYFNLVWPVGLGLWWTLRREARRGLRPHSVHRRTAAPFTAAPPSAPQFPLSAFPISAFGPALRRWGRHVLLPCAVLTALGPLVANSRAGAVIGAGSLIVATAIILLKGRHREGLDKLGIYLVLVMTLLLGTYLGWEQLGPRMEQVRQDFELRETTYRTGRLMARDCPVFGTGPGTLDPLFQLYRSSADEYWPAQLHNDWLETRITFGWVGSALIGCALLVVLARWFAPGGIRGGWRLTALVWLALGGCLAHARFDFPFQVYSLLFLFLLLCAVLSVLTRRG